MTRLPTRVWRERLASADPEITRHFQQIYGDRPDAIEHQRQRYLRLIDAYERIYGADDVWLVRAPGRVNLIGMHIDHRGGHVNPIAVKEMTFVVGSRDDNHVCFANTNPRFEPDRFSIANEVPPEPIDDWTDWTQQQADARKAAGTAGRWGNYIKASLVYLQDQLRDASGRFSPRLKGMNILADGTVPIAAGLSSSSTLVVAAMEAALVVNDLHYTSEEIVEMCGTAEWYIGTRGGKGDHAAIKLSRQGCLSHIGFFPLTVDYVPFPSDYRIVVCHSGVEASKSTDAKDVFNQRVAAYEIALMWLQHRHPCIRENVTYFRDLLSPEKLAELHSLADSVGEIEHEALLYRLLQTLPIRATRKELDTMFPEAFQQSLQRVYQTHSAPDDGYRVRGVALFGLAECARSRLAPRTLDQGRVETFGRLMSLSHDGDRVSVEVNGVRRPFATDISDQSLQWLEQTLLKEPAERARLAFQPGAYAVSCEPLDVLVDTACSVDGVLGAGRIGAGLGGCISVFVRADRVALLRETLIRRYYEPRQVDPIIEICFPVAGSGLIEVS